MTFWMQKGHANWQFWVGRTVAENVPGVVVAWSNARRTISGGTPDGMRCAGTFIRTESLKTQW
ncbi:hypothetical protein AZH51_16120 [Branchiibius sp. NY16-3462-2]|nr:hypothetical protein AZH51_16120 [Branchiibius sp. NY16-3462-2]